MFFQLSYSLGHESQELKSEYALNVLNGLLNFDAENIDSEIFIKVFGQILLNHYVSVLDETSIVGIFGKLIK